MRLDFVKINDERQGTYYLVETENGCTLGTIQGTPQQGYYFAFSPDPKEEDELIGRSKIITLQMLESIARKIRSLNREYLRR